jgi:hypothetical protein
MRDREDPGEVFDRLAAMGLVTCTPTTSAREHITSTPTTARRSRSPPTTKPHALNERIRDRERRARRGRRRRDGDR